MSRRVDGLAAWVWQRLSALYLGGFLIYLSSVLLCSGSMNYQQWTAWIVQPLNSIFIILGLFMLFLHAWIGIKDVAMDYIPSLLIRSVVMMLTGLAFMMALIWSCRVLILALIK